ncbi:MAG: hypothetical protein EXS69_01495 [Candidatus Zambryskibacteria bacterium]|nr:hypothetical protein [Candidatus Zambryskibacteria bacterium]
MNKSNKERGFIGIIVLIILGLASLKYFLNWDIFDVAESDKGKNTVLYIRDIFNTLWVYVRVPIIFVWDKILWPLLSFGWQYLQALLEWGKSRTS